MTTVVLLVMAAIVVLGIWGTFHDLWMWQARARRAEAALEEELQRALARERIERAIATNKALLERDEMDRPAPTLVWGRGLDGEPVQFALTADEIRRAR